MRWKVFVFVWFLQRNWTLSRDSWWIYYCYYCYLVVDSGYGLNHEALRVIGDHLDWRGERREQEDEKKERVIRMAARTTPTTTTVRTRDQLMWLCIWSWRKAKLLHQLQSMRRMRDKSQVTTIKPVNSSLYLRTQLTMNLLILRTNGRTCADRADGGCGVRSLIRCSLKEVVLQGIIRRDARLWIKVQHSHD